MLCNLCTLFNYEKKFLKPLQPFLKLLIIRPLIFDFVFIVGCPHHKITENNNIKVNYLINKKKKALVFCKKML